MITEKQAAKIIDLAIAHGRGRCDGIEVSVTSSSVATSRFANNGMTQNQAPDSSSISVRVQVDGRQARLSADRLGARDIRQLVERAIEAARLLEPDPEMLPMAAETGTPAQARSRFDRKTAAMTADDRAAAIRSIVVVAEKHGLTAAGVYSSGSWLSALGNSAGLRVCHRETEAECSITMVAADSTGWAKEHSVRASDIDTKAMAERAAEKALASASPIDIEPGRYTVVLEPSAVLDLLGFLWYDFTATSHSDQLSCLIGRVGQKVFGENITIEDDASHPLQAGAPFDGEGLARQRTKLVEAGTVKSLVYGRRSAKKFGVKPSGHGVSEPSPAGEYPVNLVVSGGQTPVAEMIAGTERGLLLTRVWYIREVDPVTKILTGMTRDGTFLIEDGRVRCGVKNLRFNVSLIELLNNVLALGPSTRTAGEETFPSVVPAMKVAGFNFTSTTTF